MKTKLLKRTRRNLIIVKDRRDTIATFPYIVHNKDYKEDDENYQKTFSCFKDALASIHGTMYSRLNWRLILKYRRKIYP